MVEKQVSKKTENGGDVPAKGTPEPLGPLMEFRQRMDDLFEDMMRGWQVPPWRHEFHWPERFEAPFSSSRTRGDLTDLKFDVAETDDALEISAELPGMEEKDVEVTFSDGVVTIKGEKKSETEEKKKDYYRSERRYGSFTRSFRLPDTVDEEKVKATFDKGVLDISFPKRPEAKATKKKIAISKK